MEKTLKIHGVEIVYGPLLEIEWILIFHNNHIQWKMSANSMDFRKLKYYRRNSANAHECPFCISVRRTIPYNRFVNLFPV